MGNEITTAVLKATIMESEKRVTDQIAKTVRSATDDIWSAINALKESIFHDNGGQSIQTKVNLIAQSNKQLWRVLIGFAFVAVLELGVLIILFVMKG